MGNLWPRTASSSCAEFVRFESGLGNRPETHDNSYAKTFARGYCEPLLRGGCCASVAEASVGLRSYLAVPLANLIKFLARVGKPIES